MRIIISDCNVDGDDDDDDDDGCITGKKATIIFLLFNILSSFDAIWSLAVWIFMFLKRYFLKSWLHWKCMNGNWRANKVPIKRIFTPFCLSKKMRKILDHFK